MARHAKSPFQFMSRCTIPLLTGVVASNARELLEGIRKVHVSSIFLHTHNFLKLEQHMALELASDFASWARDVLQEERLAERLAFVNPGDFSRVEDVRGAIVRVLEGWLSETRTVPLREARADQRFHFTSANTFVFPLPLQSSDLDSFAHALPQAGLDSLFYHAFESRLRLEQVENDFVTWVRSSLGDAPLADALQRLDLYALSLPGLPGALVRVIRETRAARSF